MQVSPNVKLGQRLGPSRGAGSEYALRTAPLQFQTITFNQGSPPARGSLAPHAAAPDGCVLGRMPGRSARAARGRGPRKLPVSGAPYERAAASRRSDAGGLGSPVGRSCFCLPRAARRDRGRRRTTISCLHEKRCVAVGASTTRTGGRTSSGCGFRWGRLPIGEIDHIWACAAALRHRVAARRSR